MVRPRVTISPARRILMRCQDAPLARRGWRGDRAGGGLGWVKTPVPRAPQRTRCCAGPPMGARETRTTLFKSSLMLYPGQEDQPEPAGQRPPQHLARRAKADRTAAVLILAEGV